MKADCASFVLSEHSYLTGKICARKGMQHKKVQDIKKE